MYLTSVSNFISKYFRTAINIIALMNESDQRYIALGVLEFVHQQIIHKHELFETGCVTERLSFLFYSWDIR